MHTILITMKYLTAALILLPLWAAAQDHLPSLCQSEPMIQIEAGVTVVSATIDNLLDRPCEAIVTFSDPDFLPVVYFFDSIPCTGREIASFVMPPGVPSGNASIIWQCAGLSPSCNCATITGGTGDPTLTLEHLGTVGCAFESLITSTTLVTMTRSSSTFVETVADILTASTTSFQETSTTTTQATSSDLQSTTTDTSMSTSSVSTNPTVGGTAASGWSGTSDAAGAAASSANTGLSSTLANEGSSSGSASATTSSKDADLFQDSSASRTTTPVFPAVAASLVSTLTITAGCASAL
ncbi:hypothetical protein NKR23_g2117 [Pleurostoma richardsiae]|uniref:Uncharacterized protein n=1 Tax=Pleurostoma richardsiae TaxID=41990 RepID=A0AA38SBW0_9PEZI|nr:hypothetical protein NKR23_g2117 [Pleurostoma richardsiae]